MTYLVIRQSDGALIQTFPALYAAEAFVLWHVTQQGNEPCSIVCDEIVAGAG